MHIGMFVTHLHIQLNHVNPDAESHDRQAGWLRKTFVASLLKDKKRLRLRAIHLLEFKQSNNFHIY